MDLKKMDKKTKMNEGNEDFGGKNFMNGASVQYFV
jgi:hypothetical protein